MIVTKLHHLFSVKSAYNKVFSEKERGTPAATQWLRNYAATHKDLAERDQILKFATQEETKCHA